MQRTSNMSRALIYALTLGMAEGNAYEWKGIFYTPEDTYTWGAQKVSGEYVDPTMIIAAIPVAAASEDALAGASGKGTAAFALSCEVVNSGGTITPMDDKCYKLVFDQGSAQSTFTVDAAQATAIAFFAQHLPTEFEETDHYFKDTTGADIEPVAQEPDGGHGHAHGHGGPDSYKGLCVCQAQEKGWKLDCTSKAKIEAAVANLEGNAACKDKNPPESCVTNYHVMQAHHDHCLHDALPTGIEKTLHDYEHFYDDCFVKRQFNPALNTCPEVDCSDATAMTKAVSTLQGGCASATACTDKTCADAIKVVLAAHDLCSESDLPNNLEDALHDHEEPCEDQLCNTAAGAFDPYDTECGPLLGQVPLPEDAAPSTAPPATASSASGFGRQEAFLATALALPLAMC
eukprot:gnl/MRDRNA2_/MRDRNA2_85719_c1_seq10.p1 gnl/MRDRNA2_/MRDRNA2_85719_c1~~gnl/MRDRNA2_/MRDRNA2_85719_c1_seq10.p1  ORF type:complete len:402 (+),score=62.92 gnl/MRDRNA2_/MRDRNA2_85719_c1_seq10:96-1301(+)